MFKQVKAWWRCVPARGRVDTSIVTLIRKAQAAHLFLSRTPIAPSSFKDFMKLRTNLCRAANNTREKRR